MIRSAIQHRTAALMALVALATATAAYALTDRPARSAARTADIAALCTPEGMSAVASGLGQGVTVKAVPNGPHLPGGVRLVAAAGKVPAFCQVTGSYVTNPKTGKTANFLATFPARWNGKYLQLGCSGVCGYLLMNDPTSPPIIVTAQGYPGELIEKGYATFGNDLGHVLPGAQSTSSDWMKAPGGGLDMDAIDDYLFRADRVMADMGKAFTRAVYAPKGGARPIIAKSYFLGCSQGGREALVAATRFPEKFDGVIAGSPISGLSGTLWQVMGRALLAQQPGLSKLTPGQVAMLQDRMSAKCDALDGVKDGLVQNPAACDFHPTRDLPICKPGETGDSCVTDAQAQMISVLLSGMTDESGRLLQPGYSVTYPVDAMVAPVPAGAPVDEHVRSIVGKAYDGKPLTHAQAGGPGAIDAIHLVADGAAFRKYYDIMRAGDVAPEDFAPLLKRNGKLIWYHNLSDPALTPYMSINRYKRLAELNGGYAKLQRNIRLFTLPGTGHCGITADGPSNFDAIGALENWVERGVAPNALPARQNDPKVSNILMGTVDWSKPPLRTMPLCTFPQMASYKGQGDVKDGANWECRAGDTRMLKVGVSGRQAGVAN